MRDDLRCSTLTRALGEDPGGTAARWDRIALVELPLPWPDAIEAHPLLEGIDPPDRTRVLALSASTRPGDVPEELRLLAYRRPSQGPFTGYQVTASGHAPEAMADAVQSALETPPEGGDPTGPGDVPAVRDVLICTHGTRDRCCGKFGIDLFNAVCGRISTGRWRTSHTGGHRFAPTALTLPDGCLWAHLDEGMLLGIVERSVDPDQAAPHLRGCVGIGDAPAQLADRAGLATHGWDWLGAAREATTSYPDDGQATVELKWSSPSLGEGTLRAELSTGEPVPVPPCGAPLDQATKSTPSWIMSGLDWS